MRKTQVRFSFIFVIITILLFGSIVNLVSSPIFAAAGIYEQISFQGKLVNTDGTNVSDVSRTTVFTLYDAATDGNQLWQESQSVTTTDGIFRVSLGSVTTFASANVDFNSDLLYLGVKVGADSEMTPRVRFAAVPQAFNALKVAGLTVTNTTGTLTIPNTKTISFADAFTTSGAFPLTLTTTATTNATIPVGTITLVDLASSQTLISKTIGSTGLTFSGATTDITTAADEALIITPNGAAALTLGTTGGGNTTSITLATDGTGDAEVVLPIGSISTGEILDATIDQNDLNTQGIQTDEFCLTRETTSGAPLEWQTCGAGGATAWDAIGDPAVAGIVVMGETDQNLDWNMATDIALNALEITLTNDVTGVNTQNVLRIDNLDDAGATGSVTEALLVLDNSDANEVVTAAISIVNAGGGFTDIIDNAGTLISGAELNLLDTKTGTLIDDTDLTTGDGAGGTSSGSGMEAGTGGIGLLQGCADDQILKWNESSAVWECASDRASFQNRMDGDYTNTTTTFTDVDNNSDATDDIGFAIGANETWIFQMNVQATVPAAADAKWQVTAPSGATCDISVSDIEQTLSVSNIACGASSGTMASSGGADAYWITGTVANGGTGGSVQLQYGQVSASGTTTVTLGSSILAYKITGADLAEVYYTKDSEVVPGTVVSLDSSLEAGVKKASTPYDRNLIGIITTKPGLMLGDVILGSEGAPVSVALSGRVPVKVTVENGPIEPGDYLTSSSLPGVAMKATKAGAIIGQALSGYTGEGTGQVVAFIKTTFSQGTAIANLIPGLSLESRNAPGGEEVLQSMLRVYSPLGEGSNLSEIVTDRVAAGLEVITPRVTAQEVNVNQISAATGNDVVLNLTGDGQLVIKNEVGESAITFDSLGNAYFAGIVTADKIKADQIEGLEILTNKISSLSEQVSGIATGPVQTIDNGAIEGSALKIDVGSLNESSPSSILDPQNSIIDFRSSTVNALNLNIMGILNVQGSLVVAGSAEFKEKTIFQALAEFIGNVIFRGDVEFAGRPTFNKDTGGFAVIKEGAKQIRVSFEKEYSETPVVTASSVWDISEDDLSALTQREIYLLQKQDFVVAAVTSKGFTVLLEKPAVIDLKFSWIALVVKDAKTFQSSVLSSQLSKEDQPVTDVQITDKPISENESTSSAKIN